MAFKDHGDLLQGSVSCPFADAVDGNLYLSCAVEHTFERVGCCHSQIVVAVSGDDGLVDVVDMLFEVFNLCAVLVWQAISGGVRDVDHSGTSLDDGLDHACEVLVVGASGILSVELYVVDILFGVSHCAHCALQDVFAVGIELIFDMRVTCADTRVDTFVLGIFQRLGSHVDVLFYGTCECADGRPCHRF